MNISEFHFYIRERLDRENSFVNDDLTLAQIDAAIDTASLLELERRYGVNNNSKESYDMTEKRKQELKTLHVFSPSNIETGLTPTVGLDYYGATYTINLEDCAKKVWVLTGLDVDIFKTNCGTKKVGATEIERDDLKEVMINPFEKPSYNWRRVPVILAKAGTASDNGKLFFYTGDDFSITTVYPSYLHFPTPVFYGGYDSQTGYLAADPQVNSDMPEMLHKHICDTAVVLLTGNLQDSELYKLAEDMRSRSEL